nr:protein translocase subunit SecF [Bacillota bacterium]
IGSTLTLPGIAGIVLSIGMAVDANIIIFSRIKEEIVNGRTIRAAVKTGFKRAMNTVVDSQVTTLIAAVILYQVGTSSVKGFAWTLMLGIIASIFTAVVVTQLYLNIIAGTKTFGKNKFFGIKDDGTIAFGIKRHFRFISRRKIFYVISVLVIAAGFLVGGIRGLNYGIDFTGGTMMQFDMGRQVTTEEIKDVMKDHDIDVNQMEVVFSGNDKEEVVIRTNEALENRQRAQVTEDFQKTFDLTDDDVLATELFGPSVGKELRNNAIKAILLAALGMLIYIRLRFRKWKFGAAALAGVVHDVLWVLAFYAIFQVTVNNPFIAAILTVVGYSINDTIVVFDRIRENNRFMRKESEEEIIDASINQTLTRSVMTSMTTLVVLIPLYIMTTSSIREFVLPLMVGIIVGMLSSIFVC